MENNDKENMIEKLYRHLIFTAGIAFIGVLIVLIGSRLKMYTNIMMMVFLQAPLVLL